jgi:ribosomal-protein-alanine N-acetyltransferase
MTVEDVPEGYALDVLSFNLPWTQRSFLYEVKENANSRSWVVDGYLSGRKRLVAMLVMWLILDEAHIATLPCLPGSASRE